MPRHNTEPEYKDRLLIAFQRAGKLNSRGKPDRAWLAKELKLSVQAVGQWLTGEAEPTPRNNAYAARSLECNAYWLATGDESPDLSGPFSAELLSAIVRLLPPAEIRRMENGLRGQLEMPLLPALSKDLRTA